VVRAVLPGARARRAGLRVTRASCWCGSA
jgi:hypothetical protein